MRLLNNSDPCTIHAMDPFFSANHNIKNRIPPNVPLDVAYARELLKTYGNGGEPVRLPRPDPHRVQRIEEHRRVERDHVSGLERQLGELRAELDMTKRHLSEVEREREDFALYISNKFQANSAPRQDDRAGTNGDGGDHVGRDGHSVVPPVQTHTDARQEQVESSSDATQNHGGHSGSSDPGGNGDVPQQSRDGLDPELPQGLGEEVHDSAAVGDGA